MAVCQALFNTPCFLFEFLPVVLLGYWLVPNRTWKLAWLTASSFLFYSFWDVRFVVLLILAAAVDFVVALRLERSVRHRKAWLIASIVFNLGILAIFKYAIFAAANARSVFQLLHVPIVVPYFSVVLPVGISFFTFKTMSYTIDVYRREVPACREPVKYLAFVSLFPELVAGPIVRYQNLSHQIDNLPRRITANQMAAGVTLLAIGLFKKAVIADVVASFIQPLWLTPHGLTTVTGWTAALGYTVQLYFDFSGYSDMAIGIAAMLGLRFPTNFRAPYQALNPSDFWRRWHITLSTFLRDYLYIPLGGNRKGEARTKVNLVIVMGLGGLWHGANWTFVLWGLYHGGLLMLYQSTRKGWDLMPKLAQRLVTFVLVVIGWVMFRSPDIGTAFTVYAAMFSLHGGLAGQGPLLAGILAILLAAMLALPTAEWKPSWNTRRALVVGVSLAMALFFMNLGSSPFLYYQF